MPPQARARHRELRLELHSICSPAAAPHLFAVGGGDAWLRVYDRRMAGSNASALKVRNARLPVAQAGASAQSGTGVPQGWDQGQMGSGPNISAKT